MRPPSSPASRVRRHIRGNAVAYLALFFALGLGTASATHPGGANTISSGDIITGQVKAADLGAGAVTTGRLKASAVTSAKVLDGTVANADLAASAVNSAKVATASLLGIDVSNNSLTGDDIQESTLSLANLGCQSGKVLGFARVKTQGASLPTSYTSSSQFVDFANNCAGEPVEVRRPHCCGIYYVRFVDNPAALAIAVGNTDGQADDSIPVDNTIAVGKITSGFDAGAFRVETRDVEGDAEGQHQDTNFTILLP